MFGLVDHDQVAFKTRLHKLAAGAGPRNLVHCCFPSLSLPSLKMEVSPPPTPRKTVQRRQSTTPSRRLPPRASVSRFATPPVRGPAEKLSTVADEDEVEVASTSMDVDGANELMDRILKSETVFAKSAELQVTFYSHLPGEVKQVLRNAGMFALSLWGVK